MNKNIRIEIMINTTEEKALELYDKIIEITDNEVSSCGYAIIDADENRELD